MFFLLGCTYSSNTWSCDNGCVASSVKGKDKIVLTYSNKAGRYTSQEIQLQQVTGPNVVQFPRYIVSSSLVVYDANLCFALEPP